jgi:sugar phosphate isomerase/epimerase
MDARAEFEAFLRFLHDNGVQLRAVSPFGGWEEGGYEERRLADAYEAQARTAAPAREGASRRVDAAEPAAAGLHGTGGRE